jgi:hypothetical protein
MDVTTIRQLPSPLGLPPGSVRAILALVLCGSLWYEVLKGVPASPTPILLESSRLVVAFYFGVRSTAPLSQPVVPTALPVKQPLRLPRGTIRGILLIGFFGVIAYLWFQGRPLFAEFALILQVLASYLVGVAISQAIERRRRAGKVPSLGIRIWRNVNALGAIALTVYICGVLLGRWSQLAPPQFAVFTENALAWVVAYYFGSRVSP